MTFLRTRDFNLLDTIGRHPREWWLVYTLSERAHWWNRFLHPRFQHVSALRREGALWVLVEPCGELLDIKLIADELTPWQLFPQAIIQRVVGMPHKHSLRSRFFLGPVTCVEHVKALLGISAWCVRTPRQLHDFCRDHLAKSNPLS